jgi:hypothetical protein
MISIIIIVCNVFINLFFYYMQNIMTYHCPMCDRDYKIHLQLIHHIHRRHVNKRSMSICDLCCNAFRFKNIIIKNIHVNDIDFKLQSCYECYQKDDDLWINLIRHKYQIEEALDYDVNDYEYYWSDDEHDDYLKNNNTHYWNRE